MKVCEDGIHEPVRNSIEARGQCQNCRAYEREIWAHGEQLWRHMHRYEGDGDLLVCECGARLGRSEYEARMEEGRASRERRLERVA